MYKVVEYGNVLEDTQIVYTGNLKANRDKFDEFDTVDYQKLPAGKLTVDNLNDAGIKNLQN